MKRVNSASLAIVLLSAGLLVAACGGGGGGALKERNLTQQLPDPPPLNLRHSDFATTGAVRTQGMDIGIGPAFQPERPAPDQLDTKTSRDGVAVSSGHWHDVQGRDGSATASEVIAFLQAFQRQTYRERGLSADLVIGDYSLPRTLRIGSNVGQSDRELILKSLQNINGALPYRNRIRLGENVSLPLSSPEDIPQGEIHIHITNGKSEWPIVLEEQGIDDVDRVLGFGGANFDENTRQAVNGYAWIDRSLVARGYRYSVHMEFIITHELLHAYGIVAHVDQEASNGYPDSLLVPELPVNLRVVPRLFTSLDGELLLALNRFQPGTPINSLTPEDLGAWEVDGFYLAGTMNTAGGSVVEFGAGFRNGLAKPWAAGPRPTTLINDNPSLRDMNTATWIGTLLGFTQHGHTVSGDSIITLGLDDLYGRASFEEIESWGSSAHPGTKGSGQMWGDGDLNYTIIVPSQLPEGFVSVSAQNDDVGTVTGIFTGAQHEGVAGVLEHPDLSAAFGAVR